MSKEQLTEIIERLKEIGAVKLHAEASGSGDEGFIDCVTAFDGDEGELDEDSELQSLVEDAFENHGYDYYNGDGGRVTLEIDLVAGKAKWTDEAYVTKTSPVNMRDALVELCETIEITGGCVLVDGCYVPSIDPDWVDLGCAYISACKAIGRTPVVSSEDAEEEDGE